MRYRGDAFYELGSFMNRIEDAIQAAVIDWVHKTHTNIMITTTGNEKFYKGIIASLGIPDLILFDWQTGRVLFLELKKKRGKLLPSQKTWNQVFDASNVLGWSRDVAYGYEEALRIISGFI